MLLITHVDYIAGRLMKPCRSGPEALVGAINQFLFVHITRLTFYIYVNQYYQPCFVIVVLDWSKSLVV